MKKLHPNQKELLNLLRKNIETPLTVAELMDELGVSSTSVVQYHIQQLEKKGYLKRNQNNPKDYQILSDPEKPITYINQYGLAQCGAEGSILDDTPIDRVPIASKLIKFDSSLAFIVTAKGDSMEPTISAGDLVIVQQCKIANNGDIIVCVNKEQALIKVFKKGKGKIELVSLNDQKHKPFAAAKDFRIVGIVKNIIKYS